MRGVFTFDPRCFKKGPFLYSVRVDLLQLTADRWGKAAGAGKSCVPKRPCRLVVDMQHSEVEMAKYKFRLFFPNRRGNSNRVNIGWFECYSALLVANCDA
jgi:hypothetical protein